jgi:hypothetical protein
MVLCAKQSFANNLWHRFRILHGNTHLAMHVGLNIHPNGYSPSHILHSHFQAWKFTGSIAFATAIFVAGYVYREIGAYNYTNIIDYVVSLCLVYGAAPVYELANYVIFGRILYYVPYYSPLHPGRVITTYGFLSTIVEVLNANGARLLSDVTLSQKKQDIGHNLLKAGLVMQLAVIFTFLGLAISFQRKCRKNGLMPRHLHSVLTTLYISSALILIRTIYRSVEYFSALQIHVVPGFDPMSISPIIRYEWFFWVFEATIMLVNTLLLNFRHPAMYLPRSNKIYLAEDGETEIMGPGYEDRRNFLLTLVDPCDIIGLLVGRDKKERYWENHERVLPNQLIGHEVYEVKGEGSRGKSVKTNPWGLFKWAFFSDRGNQSKDPRIETPMKSTTVPETPDIEKVAGQTQPQLHQNMVGPA